jgi:hypothetical protein
MNLGRPSENNARQADAAPIIPSGVPSFEVRCGGRHGVGLGRSNFELFAYRHASKAVNWWAPSLSRFRLRGAGAQLVRLLTSVLPDLPPQRPNLAAFGHSVRTLKECLPEDGSQTGPSDLVRFIGQCKRDLMFCGVHPPSLQPLLENDKVACVARHIYAQKKREFIFLNVS